MKKIGMAFLIPAFLLIWASAAYAADIPKAAVTADTLSVYVSGDGEETLLHTYSLGELETLAEGPGGAVRRYVSIDALPAVVVTEAQGIDMEALLKDAAQYAKAGMPAEPAAFSGIRFLSLDGYRRTFSGESFKAVRYYYPGLLNAELGRTQETDFGRVVSDLNAAQAGAAAVQPMLALTSWQSRVSGGDVAPGPLVSADRFRLCLGMLPEDLTSGRSTTSDLSRGVNQIVLLLSETAETGVAETGAADTSGTASPGTFTDIAGHWAAGDIAKLAGEGLVAGMADGSFKPDQPVSRAEFLVMLIRVLNQKDPVTMTGEHLFSDTRDHWSGSYISTGVSLGIAGGYPDGRFGPDDPIDRQQMAAMLARAFGFTGGALGFEDDDAIADWAKGSVAALSARGVISGFPDGAFGPQRQASRAEACVALLRAMNADLPPYALIALTGTEGEAAATWWSEGDQTASALTYGRDPSLGDARTAAGTVTLSQDGVTVMEARLTGLTEGVYYYRAGNGRIQRFEYKNPDWKGDFSFLFLGDIQYDQLGNIEQEYASWRAMAQKAASSEVMGGPPAFALMAGDFVDNGQSLDLWRIFLKNAAPAFATLPMMPVPGNHEYNAFDGGADMYLKLFDLPKNGPEGFREEFYSFDYGNAHITALSSNILSGERPLTEAELERIKEWIAADLKGSGALWKIAIMHHPAYAVVPDKVGSVLAREWTPVFEANGLDLALCGHQHIYMRTDPMFEGKRDDLKGITYVMGNSGPKHYAPASAPYARVMIPYISQYTLFKVSRDTLTLQTFSDAHEQLDEAVIYAEGAKAAAGDLNRDGRVDQSDLELLLDAILKGGGDSGMDINGDGRTDILDAHELAALAA